MSAALAWADFDDGDVILDAAELAQIARGDCPPRVAEIARRTGEARLWRATSRGFDRVLSVQGVPVVVVGDAS